MPSSRHLRGLDWLNFFLADVQTGVGPFLAVYLAGYRWNEESVGIALMAGGIAGILLSSRGRGGRIRHPPALHAGDTRYTIPKFNPRSTNRMSTVLLLVLSNVFMTFAWYGHLKYGHDWPLWKAIVVSWAIALIEYCLAVPANRLGFSHFSGFQLKFIQEVVTLVVFTVFAVMFLKEKLAWNYLVAFVFLSLAAFFAFAFKAPGPAA
jgi:uncharacterized protein (DUF486 family)